MNNRDLSLKDRVVIRLMTEPGSLDMRQFSALTRPARRSRQGGITYCLAGIILDVFGVSMEYGEDGFAVGLGKGETQPSTQWIDYEVSLSKRLIDRATVTIAAKAREIWAHAYGEEAAKMLPFYAPEWGVAKRDLSKIKAVDVVDFLENVEWTRCLPHGQKLAELTH